ncbi:hypothetical protein AcW1_000921 [Taiwanofungus camphoratus]|nr:hypothetical protein AcW2_000579 [Antrodia cinnamomea]KAI0936774.1 hypothetical protein AcV5_004825 [Antrodia cinnamomea]KAI0961995.1 hypothetical protein AcV7_000940 [Antrodia cinnamomea]KAI0963999.1 hypothetical protein AcW1_000921 [Antrodia cinnamomea]
MARALPNAPVTPASSSAGASHTYNLRKSSRGFPMTPVEVEILMTIYNRTEKPSRKDKEKLAKELHRPYATIDNWFSNRRRRTARASKATEKKRCSAPLGRTMDRLGNNSWTTLRDAVPTMRVCTTPKTTKDEQDSSRSWPQALPSCT